MSNRDRMIQSQMDRNGLASVNILDQPELNQCRTTRCIHCCSINRAKAVLALLKVLRYLLILYCYCYRIKLCFPIVCVTLK